MTRALAFYLPQFHPIPENDAWWGHGFTEWTNVRKARPRFRGHYQPHVSGELGYYDLRDPSVQVEQARLAQAHCVHGFIYYHYWFSGKRLLQHPLEAMLANDDVTIPFALCWANENWTRTWDGQEQQVLVQQEYKEEDVTTHAQLLARVMSDRRYLRIDGRPLFLVYNAAALPDEARFTTGLRRAYSEITESELYLCRVESGGAGKREPTASGWDAAVDFQPDSRQLPRKSLWWRGAHRLTGGRGHWSSIRYDYAMFVRTMLQRPEPEYKRFPGVTPSWDNSARRRRGAFILTGSTPALFEHWVREVIGRFRPSSDQEDLIFVNAWNEWAEGNHLEPDQLWGREWLEALQRGLSSGGTGGGRMGVSQPPPWPDRLTGW